MKYHEYWPHSILEDTVKCFWTHEGKYSAATTQDFTPDGAVELSECTRVQQDLAIAESQLRDYEARLGKPFLHDAYLSELTSLRDQLKAGLSAKIPEPGT